MSGFPSCFNGVCSTMYIKMVYETILETNVLENRLWNAIKNGVCEEHMF